MAYVPVPILEIKNLQKIYPNGLQALKGINLTVQAGDFYALLGKNGAGKSTAIGMITSLIKKTSGSIWIDGWDLEKNPIEAKLNMGVVPQELNFNSFEKVENVLINQALYYGVPISSAKKRLIYLLTEMGLLNKKDLAVRQLSGGMKRRLMIARALMHSPRLLILDEPTAGVDIEVRQSLWKFLKKLNQEEGLTIILTTHYLEEAENLCHKIAILDHGEILIDTDISTVLQQLEGETVVIQLEQESDLMGPWRQIDSKILEIDLLKTECLSDVLDNLKNKGLKVYRVWNKSNRLEQLFLSLTGVGSHEKK